MASNTLGVAWIQIKPSLSGISGAISSELNRNAASAGTNAGSAFSGKWAVAMGAISGITSQVFQSVSNTITNNLSGAITRADTLERFPKVMSQLGYSTDDAAAAIIKLRDGVQGVPTSLADVVSGTQRLVSITKDVGKAADWSLAISDAMISNGASAERASQAMEQFMQVISRGKPTGQDWLTIMEVAPGTMQALAESLGYASATMGGDMYTALQTGKLSIEDFMSALVKLDKEGSGSMTSLSELARTATGGIETAMTTMGQSVQNAIVAVIQSIGFDNITNAIDTVKNVLVTIVNVIGAVISKCIELKDVILPIVAGIGGAVIAMKAMQVASAVWAVMKTAITGVQTAIAAYNAGLKISTAIQAAFNGVVSANPIGLLVTAIAAVVAALVWFFTQTEAGKAIIEGLGQVLGSVFSALGEFFQSVGEWIGNVWNGVTTFFSNLFTLIGTVAQWVWDNVLSPIINFFIGYYTTIWNIITGIFTFIVAIFTTVVQWVWENVISPLVNFIVGYYTTVWEIITAIWNAITTVIGAVSSWVWENVISPIINFFTVLWDAITGVVYGIWSTICGVFSAIAGWIYGNVIQPIASFFDALWNGIRAGCEAIAGAIGTVFGVVVGAVKAPINGIISAINGVIDTINSIEVPEWVPGIGGAHANIPHIPHLATGGRIIGTGSSLSDSNLVALSQGEYVLRAAAAHQIGYDTLDAMNATGSVGGKNITQNFVINGYNKSPEELADIISHKIALSQRGVF